MISFIKFSMKYRSDEGNSWTKRTNLRLIYDRSYEVKKTLDFSKDQMLGPCNYNCN